MFIIYNLKCLTNFKGHWTFNPNLTISQNLHIFNRLRKKIAKKEKMMMEQGTFSNNQIVKKQAKITTFLTKNILIFYHYEECSILTSN